MVWLIKYLIMFIREDKLEFLLFCPKCRTCAVHVFDMWDS